jgi:hypothetical protein
MYTQATRYLYTLLNSMFVCRRFCSSVRITVAAGTPINGACIRPVLSLRHRPRSVHAYPSSCNQTLPPWQLACSSGSGTADSQAHRTTYTLLGSEETSRISWTDGLFPSAVGMSILASSSRSKLSMAWVCDSNGAGDEAEPVRWSAGAASGRWAQWPA